MSGQEWGTWQFSPTLNNDLCELADDFDNPHSGEFNPWQLLLKPHKPQYIKKSEKRTLEVLNLKSWSSETTHSTNDLPWSGSDNKPNSQEHIQMEEADDSSDIAVPLLIEGLKSGAITSDQVRAASDNQLKLAMTGLSDEGLCNAVNSICHNDCDSLALPLCTYILQPLLLDDNQSCSRLVLAALVELVNHSPELCCSKLLVPLMATSEPKQAHSCLPNLVDTLSPHHKGILLRGFLDSSVTCLKEWQLVILNVLVVPTSDDMERHKLITLIASSSESLASNVKFGKLLVNVIKMFGPNASAKQINSLNVIVANNKSLFKRTAEKALKIFEEQ